MTPTGWDALVWKTGKTKSEKQIPELPSWSVESSELQKKKKKSVVVLQLLKAMVAEAQVTVGTQSEKT